MATITPLQYAKNYWEMQVPIVEDTTEKVKEWVTVRVDRLDLQWWANHDCRVLASWKLGEPA